MLTLLIIAAIIIAICLIHIGVDFTYDSENVVLIFRIAGFSIKLLPKKIKKAAVQAEAAEKNVKEKIEKKFNYHMAAEIAHAALKLLKRRFPPLWHSIVFSKLALKIVIATDDAAKTAESYGRVCAAASALYPILREILNIKKCDISFDLDFQTVKTVVMSEVKIRMTVGAILIFAFTFGGGILINYFKIQKKYDTIIKA